MDKSKSVVFPNEMLDEMSIERTFSLLIQMKLR